MPCPFPYPTPNPLFAYLFQNSLLPTFLYSTSESHAQPEGRAMERENIKMLEIAINFLEYANNECLILLP